MAQCNATSQNEQMARELGSLWETADIAPGDWILPRLHAFNQDTGSVVPAGFEGYCRIFHPVVPSDPSAPVRTWTEVAAMNGRIAHPSMQYHMINRPVGSSTPGPNVQDDELSWGSLPVAERIELVELLRDYSATPDRCWFGVWAGYGDVDTDGERLLRHPGRDFIVLSGSIDAVVGSPHAALGRRSPNLWWPEDRRWIVVTEIDFAWTYVGGPSHLIEDLLSHRELEVMSVKLSDKPFFGSDYLNASLDE
jgi:hypothetical protein